MLGALVWGCGGADPNALFDDSGTTDDVINPADAGKDTSPPTKCPTGDTCGDPNVPGGWTPVAYTTDKAPPCPADFGTLSQGVTDPTLGTGSCSCACAIGQSPDCETGSSTWSGVGSTCSTGASPLNFSGGLCRLTYGTVDDYDQATTIPAAGGTCSVQAVVDSSGLTTTSARLCTPNATCSGAVCNGFAPSGFTACITTTGDVTCPTASVFTNKHLVASGFNVSCSDCGTACTFNGSCAKPTLSFYSDQTCTTLITSIPADSTCVATGHNGAQVYGTKYTASPSFTGCTATGTSTASTTPQNPQTVCCR